jgi:hypothetical protein
LRHYATGGKVAGSRTDEGIELYQFAFSFQPLIEMSTGDRFLSSYLILLVALGPGVYSASNRNEYQKHKNNVSGE